MASQFTHRGLAIISAEIDATKDKHGCGKAYVRWESQVAHRHSFPQQETEVTDKILH
jgi:hypothetical protein